MAAEAKFVFLGRVDDQPGSIDAFDSSDRSLGIGDFCSPGGDVVGIVAIAARRVPDTIDRILGHGVRSRSLEDGVRAGFIKFTTQVFGDD